MAVFHLHDKISSYVADVTVTGKGRNLQGVCAAFLHEFLFTHTKISSY